LVIFNTHGSQLSDKETIAYDKITIITHCIITFIVALKFY